MCHGDNKIHNVMSKSHLNTAFCSFLIVFSHGNQLGTKLKQSLIEFYKFSKFSKIWQFKKPMAHQNSYVELINWYGWCFSCEVLIKLRLRIGLEQKLSDTNREFQITLGPNYRYVFWPKLRKIGNVKKLLFGRSLLYELFLLAP